MVSINIVTFGRVFSMDIMLEVCLVEIYSFRDHQVNLRNSFNAKMVKPNTVSHRNSGRCYKRKLFLYFSNCVELFF